MHKKELDIPFLSSGERLTNNFSLALLGTVKVVDAFGVGKWPLIKTFRNAARDFFYDQFMNAQFKEAYPRALEANRRDGLTGAFTRKEFDRTIAELDKTDSPVAVVIVDADHFKSINDTYGHQTGDDVLREITAAIEKTLNRRHTLYRYGGEEFAILMTDTSVDQARQGCEYVRQSIASHAFHVRNSEQTIPVTASIGVAARQLGENMADTIAASDRALYAAKQGGRNRVVVSRIDAGVLPPAPSL